MSIGMVCLLIYTIVSLFVTFFFFTNLPFGDLKRKDFILYQIWHNKKLTYFGIFFCSFLVFIWLPLLAIADLIFIFSLKE